MTGWLLIIALLVLGGVLSTFGDMLGSRVGKARLSVFNLRPRRTAVVITVFTGSLISALSLGFMLLVSRQLRVGLFELDDLQEKLKTSRLALAPLKAERKRLEARIDSGEKELKQLERNLIALRRGDVVVSSGQLLANTTLQLKNPGLAKEEIDSLLQKANLEAFRRVRPGEMPNRQILRVPKVDIRKLEQIIIKRGTWVVNVRSAANVLLGEEAVYAYPEVRPNIKVVRSGETLASTFLNKDELDLPAINKKIKLLLASTLAEVKRRGSLSLGLQFDPNAINSLIKELRIRRPTKMELRSIALRDSDTADPVVIFLDLRD